jgi:hypothetical protein
MTYSCTCLSTSSLLLFLCQACKIKQKMHKQHAIEEGPKPSMPKCQKPFNENLISLWMKGGFKPASGFRPARLEM